MLQTISQRRFDHPFLAAATVTPAVVHPSFLRRRRRRSPFRFPRRTWPAMAQVLDSTPPPPPPADDGPVELPPSSSPVTLGDLDQATPLQVATSVLLTGAIAVFLFRSLRRRAKRAKELRVRSSGVTKRGVKEEALESLKAMQSAKLEPGAPPSPLQALWGGLTAGAIAILLYKFTATIEGALNRQTISDNFSVRQITITIRTIINGLCYLATFVFGANSVGLILYSGQLAINSFMENSEETVNTDEQKSSSDSTLDPGDAGGQKESDPQTLDKTQ